ncbi:hypothetical protein M011DRAFT_474973 [Sporormia fimetaria CBS 119925]|uniref:Uncharacterized protein n=1 Tax=Sporormia fimetaria CBS 119925 TaxID=1340428 RepID=A0A6A6VIT3_9PLEO|nr:hypothetical protein M011DRAFT_474973 [Sporormia fimetaria CBS 119925]
MSAEELGAALTAPESSIAQLASTAADFSGESLPDIAARYLDAFCDNTISPVRRRWTGLVLAKLLRASSDVIKHLSTRPEKLSGLGKTLCGPELEETRIVAGVLIREALIQGTNLLHCWPSDKVPNSVRTFPQDDGNRWIEAFQGYLDALFDLKLMETAKNTGGLAVLYSVCCSFSDGTKWAPSDGANLVVLIQAGCLTLVATDLNMHSSQFLDIPLHHILETELQKARLYDSQSLGTEQEPWEVVLNLKDLPWTYRLNSTNRYATEIRIMFRHRLDAAECETCIKESNGEHSGLSLAASDAEIRRVMETPIKKPGGALSSIKRVKGTTTFPKETCEQDRDDLSVYDFPPDSPGAQDARRKPSSARPTKPKGKMKATLRATQGSPGSKKKEKTGKKKLPGTGTIPRDSVSEGSNVAAIPSDRLPQKRKRPEVARKIDYNEAEDPEYGGSEVECVDKPLQRQQRVASGSTPPNYKASKGVNPISVAKLSPHGSVIKSTANLSSGRAASQAERSIGQAPRGRASKETSLAGPLAKTRHEIETLQSLVHGSTPVSRSSGSSQAEGDDEILDGAPVYANSPLPARGSFPHSVAKSHRKRTATEITVETPKKAKRVKQCPFTDAPRTAAPLRCLHEQPTSPSLHIKHAPLSKQSPIQLPISQHSDLQMLVDTEQPQDPALPEDLNAQNTPFNRNAHLTEPVDSGEGHVLSSNSKPLPAPPTEGSKAISGYMTMEDLDEETLGVEPLMEIPFDTPSKMPNTKLTRTLSARALKSKHKPKTSSATGRQHPSPSLGPHACRLGKYQAEPEPDQDETLVEPAAPFLKTRKTLESSPPVLHRAPSSHSSTSALRSPTPDDAPEAEAEDEEWEASLKPHQREYGARVTRVVRRVLRHVVDSETAVDEVVKTYAEDGQKLIDELAERHREEYAAKSAEVQAQRQEVRREFLRRAEKLKR